MKKLLIALGVLLAGVPYIPAQQPAAPAAPAPAPQAAPVIVCDQPAYEFGNADPAVPVQHTFLIANKGDAPLAIRRVQPSCGCTTAQISQTNINPGETATLPAQVNLQGRSGAQEKHIAIESNDPRTPTLMLTLKGNVRPDLQVEPESLTVSPLRGDQPVTVAVVFTNHSAAPIKVTRVETTATNLTASIAALEEGKAYRVSVSTVPPLQTGPVEGMVRIFTDSPARPVFEVPYHGVVMGPIVVAPQQLLVPLGKEPVSRRLILKPGAVSQFKVLGVVGPDPAIKWQVSALPGNGVNIQFSNLPGRADLNGKALRILTDVDAMREIDVPILVVSPAG